MRAVRRLKLVEYRNHARYELALDGGPVALHGPNGVGKTNILEAVSLLSPGRGLRGAAAEEIPRRQTGLGWRIEALIETPEGLWEASTGVSAPGAKREVRLDGKAAAQTALGARLPMTWLTPAMDRLWTEGATGRRRFLDRLTLAFDPCHAEQALTYEKAMRERNRLLKDGPDDPAWLTALEAQMAPAAAALARARAETAALLEKAQEGAETAFPRARIAAVGSSEQRFADIIAAGGAPAEEEVAEAAALAASWAAGRSADMRAGRTLTGPHRTDLSAIYEAKGVEAKLCSTGEQKALLVSLVLASARALTAKSGAPPILLLDEVAAHLDADRRAALFDEVVALGAQAWMTGAGAELFESLGDRGQSVALPGGG